MKLRRIISNNWFILRIFAKNAPTYFYMTALSNVLVVGSEVITNSLMAKFMYDALSQRKPLGDIFAVIGAVAALLTVRHFVRAYTEESLREKAKAAVYGKLQGELFAKASTLDLSCYDDPKFYDGFVWAMSSAEEKALAVFQTANRFMAYVLAFCGYGGVMLALDPFVFIPAALFFLMTFALNMRRVKINFAKESELKPEIRKRDYATRVFYLKDFAKELRTTQIGGIILHNFRESVSRIKAIAVKHGKRLALISVIDEVLGEAIILNAGVYAYLGYRLLVTKTITIGSLMSLAFATENLIWRMNQLISFVPEFTEHALYIEKLRGFLDYEAKVVGGRLPVPQRGTLRLDNVSFGYGDTLVLDNINMIINVNEKVAIVGYNGAGKSTLVKLLMRLYDPQSGTITLNGIDIREFDLYQYRRSFAAVFQDFAIFAAELGENVALRRDYDAAAAESALAQSSFDPRKLAGGIRTQLTKEFHDDGHNLSGGESQKVAAARAFYKSCPFAVLDEPSAALDPIAEYNLNQTLAAAAADRTVLFISHRLSTTKVAETIYMLERGRIIEQGSHADLLSSGDKYAHMWQLQAKKYNNFPKK